MSSSEATIIPKNRRLSTRGGSHGSNAIPDLDDLIEGNRLQSDRKQRRRSSFRRHSLKFGPNVELEEGVDSSRLQAVLDNYSAVLKLCSENKVNTKNTWSLNLIDHIEDILATQRGSFQKASCTLQASVQIYEKRVDAAHQDTFKMLDNVNRTNKRGDNDGEEERERLLGGVEGSKSSRKRGGVSTSSTLESNLNNITQRRFDREFEVDPLFRKMSQAFDEGGARGMLLNQLSVHEGPRVVFDTSEARALCERDDITAVCHQDQSALKLNSCDASDNDDDSEEKGNDREFEEATTLPRVQFGSELSALMKKLINKVHSARMAPSLDIFFEDIANCLKADPVNGSLANQIDNVSLGPMAATQQVVPSDTVDDDVDGPSSFYDYDDNDGAELGGFGYSDDEGDIGEFDERRLSHNSNQAQSSMENPGVAGLTSALDALELQMRFDQTPEESDYSFFARKSGTTASQQWAGPSHWKFVGKRPPTRTSAIDVVKEEGGGKKQKTVKPKYFIDFYADYDTDFDSAVALPKSVATTMLPKNARSTTAIEALETFTLPTDERYREEELRRLFLKPNAYLLGQASAEFGDSNNLKVALATRNPFTSASTSMAEQTNTENTELQFEPEYGGYDSDDGGGCNPYDFESDDEYSMSHSQLQDTFDPAQGRLNLVDPSRQVGRIQIGYEKRAKRVDVKKLKSSLWDHIEIAAPVVSSTEIEAQEDNRRKSSRGFSESPEKNSDIENIDDGNNTFNESFEKSTETTNQKKLSFAESIGDLGQTMSSNITVPFYFICVLHLANEKGLHLEGSEDLTDFQISLDEAAKPAC